MTAFETLPIGRREWLKAAGGFACTWGLPFSALAAGADKKVDPPSARARVAESGKALIAITLDLEMSRNFPKWEDTHWDYMKGVLNDETKRYSVEAARRVKAAGGVIHFFSVGRVLEQPDVKWLQEIVRTGHPVGNHTYDHINVLAKDLKDLQFRFQRSPWLLRDQSVTDAIRENIILTQKAMKARIGVLPNGFRTPGGFAEGLKTAPQIRSLLKEVGYSWVSSLYPAHPPAKPDVEPDRKYLDSIVAALPHAQPFVYPDGLVEIPMSPISDVGAFRTGRWKLDWYLRAVRAGVEWAIETGGVFDYLSHPSISYVMDPEFKAVELICELVKKAGNKAAIVDLGTIASRAQKSAPPR